MATEGTPNSTAITTECTNSALLTRVDCRQVRRKSRYRGNPERARFHRPDTVFEITTQSGLVDEMRSIRIAASTLEHCVDEPSINLSDRVSSDAATVEELGSCGHENAEGGGMCSEPALDLELALDLKPALELEPALDLEPESEPESESKPASEPEPEPESEPESEPEPEPTANRRNKPSTTQKQPTTTDQTVLDMPARMTRSMARKAGIQHPRRYFGEGVSASQILRP